MPFVTEEIYQRFNAGSITTAPWPEADPKFDFSDASRAEILFDIITAVRGIRAEKNVSYHQLVDLEIEARAEESVSLITAHLPYIQRFANYRNINFGTEKIDATGKVLAVYPELTVAVPLAQLINIEEERAKLQAKLEKTEAEIARCENMLKNPNFVSKAPAEKVELEREKLVGFRKQKEEIEKLLNELNK